jgi:tetratricopeptide (TPR) repeat protein
LEYKVDALIEAKKFAGALELIDMLLQKHPRDLELLTKKAKVLEKLERYDEEIQVYDLAISIEPSPYYTSEKADIFYYYKDEPAKALSLYESCLAEQPADTYVLQQIARCHTDLRDYPNAISFYEKAILFEEDPEYAMKYVLGIKKTHFDNGLTCLERQNYDEARSLFTKAMEISVTEDPYDVAPEDYTDYRTEEDFDPYEEIRNSLSQYDTFCEIKSADTYFREQDFNRVLALYPRNSRKNLTVEGVINKAICYMEVGDPLNAIHCLRIAERNKFDVQDMLDYLENQYKQMTAKVERGNEVIETLIAEADAQLRTITRNEDDISANLQLFSGTVRSDLEQCSFEDAFNHRYFCLDEYLNALTTMSYGAMLLYKFSVPTPVYRHWVKQQHHSLQSRLNKLDKSKLNDEYVIDPLKEFFIAKILDIKGNGSDTSMKITIEQKFVRVDNQVLFSNGQSATVSHIEDESGNMLEIAFPGQTVEITLEEVPYESVKNASYLFKTRKHPYLWYTERLLEKENESVKSLQRFNFSSENSNKAISEFTRMVNLQKKELLRFNGVDYKNEKEVSFALAQYKKNFFAGWESSSRDIFEAIKENLDEEAYQGQFAMQMKDKVVQLMAKEKPATSVNHEKPEASVKSQKHDLSATKPNTDVTKIDAAVAPPAVIFDVVDSFKIGGLGFGLQGKIEKGEIRLGDWLKSDEGKVVQVTSIAFKKRLVDCGKQGDTVELLFKTSSHDERIQLIKQLTNARTTPTSTSSGSGGGFISELTAISTQGLSEQQMKKKINELKLRYNMMEMDSIIYEGAHLGKIYSIPDCKEKSWEERRNFISSMLERVKYLKIEGLALMSVLSQLKDLGLISKFSFFELEKKTIGGNLSASEADKNELAFIEIASKKYKARGTSPFGKQIGLYEDQYFDCARFINDFMKDRKALDDKLLFSCKEETMMMNPKEGFVVSSQAIYSYGWSKPVLLKDIEDIYIKNSYSILINTVNSSNPMKLYAVPLIYKAEFVRFMKDLLNEYRRIFKIESVEKKVSASVAAASKEDVPPTTKANDSKGQAPKPKEQPEKRAVPSNEKKEGVRAIISEFKKAGLEAENPTTLKQKEFGPSRKDGLRILVPTLGDDAGGRIFEFKDLEALQLAKSYYDDLSKRGPITFSHTFAKGLFLLQMNGNMEDEYFEQYKEVMDRFIPEIEKEELKESEPVQPPVQKVQPKKVEKPSNDKVVVDMVKGLYTSFTGSCSRQCYLFDDSSANAKKKFNNVFSSYGNLEKGETALLLFDNTAFGSAKDGFLITNRNVYWHNMWSSKGKIELNKIHQVELKKDNLYINGEEIQINLISKSEKQEFGKKIEKLLLNLAKL